MRRAFTLVEMTIVVAIIAIMAGMALSVYNAAVQQSKGMRTRAIISKIDDVVSAKWDGYSVRPLPIRVQQTTPGILVNQQDFAALRDLSIAEFKRLELPESVSDVSTTPGTITSGTGLVTISRPTISKQFLRRAIPGWTTQNESAECLYLILAATRNGDGWFLDWFPQSEIGDTDNDGMLEILDGWGRPIQMNRRLDGVLVFSSGQDATDSADDLTNHDGQ